ncbi:hypothetical protein JCM10207_001554 [Rhodosporidiobolus poonsookiae]
MSTRTRQPRKAASNVTYSDPPEYEGIDSDEEASEEEEEWGGERTRKGRGKANKQRMSRGGDSSEEDDDDAKPARKKRRATKGTRKGKKDMGEGKLEVLKSMPIEILLEIFAHLNPRDLLAVSNTSKTYHALLAAPASSSLWRNARKRYELPDSKIDDFSEMQYAQLIFGTHCQHCRTKKVNVADCFIRQRICTDCRREKLVRLDQLGKEFSYLHPQATACVIPSYHSPSAQKWTVTNPYGFATDLEYYSEILYNLEDEASDRESDDEGDKAAPLPQPSTSTSSRAGTRSRPDAARPTYVESSDEEDEDPRKYKSTRRVNELLAERKKLRNTLEEEGRAMRIAARQAVNQLQREKDASNNVSWTDRMIMFNRADQIEAKVLALGLGYESSDFTRGWTNSPLVTSKEPLTDEVWETIKPDILKLVARLRRKRLSDELKDAQTKRQRELRPRYDKLTKSLDKSARPFLPLFVDFLVFPSVRPLWNDLDAELDDAAWNDALDDMREEIEQYRLELCLHARSVVIAATRESDSDEGDDGDDEHGAGADEEELPSDAFFAKCTSFVACNFSNCHKTHRHRKASTAAFWTWSPMIYTYDPNAIGSLVEVLKHQHKLHNFVNEIKPTKKMLASTSLPPFRVHLPEVVSSAMAAILDVGELDPETAGYPELSTLSQQGWLSWENSTMAKKHFSSVNAWRELLCLVKRAAIKADKSKSRVPLDPPCIELNPSTWENDYVGFDPSKVVDNDGDSSAHDTGEAKKKKGRRIRALNLGSGEDSDDNLPAVKPEPASSDEDRLVFVKSEPASSDDEGPVMAPRQRAKRFVDDDEDSAEDESDSD